MALNTLTTYFSILTLRVRPTSFSSVLSMPGPCAYFQSVWPTASPALSLYLLVSLHNFRVVFFNKQTFLLVLLVPLPNSTFLPICTRIHLSIISTAPFVSYFSLPLIFSVPFYPRLSFFFLSLFISTSVHVLIPRSRPQSVCGRLSRISNSISVSRCDMAARCEPAVVFQTLRPV